MRARSSSAVATSRAMRSDGSWRKPTWRLAGPWPSSQDWELTKKYLKEQCTRVGPCYYNTKGLFVQVGNNDAEQFYSCIMLTLLEFLDQYSDVLYDWAYPNHLGLLMPGEAPALDERSASQFEHLRLYEERCVGETLRQIAEQGSLDGLENRIEYVVVKYTQAYLQEFLRQSFPQF